MGRRKIHGPSKYTLIQIHHVRFKYKKNLYRGYGAHIGGRWYPKIKETPFPGA